ncbi:unnamed protein product, partial [Rotaria magnacalcarata]
MLQHNLFSNGHFLLKSKSHYRISSVLRRLASYDQHESPTLPHLTHANPVLTLTDIIPSACQIVIAGGGIIGQSVAYHLSEYGAKDIVLLEKAKLASGSTWQSAGQGMHIQNTLIQTYFTKYSRELYKKLHDQGHDVGFSEKGGLWIAQTADRLHTLKRQYAIIKALDIDCELLNIDKIKERLPFINSHEIWGGLLIKDDFMVDPVPLALAFAKLAIDKGVKIIEDCAVTEILTEKQRAGQYDRITSVVTSQGPIKCDIFINCTGLWARELGYRSSPGVRIPTQACEYICLKTKPIANFPKRMPIVHNPDERFYLQPLANDAVLVGGFLRESKPIYKQGTFGKARWFNIVKREYNACRKGVAIIDMTSFTKYELKSANRSVVDFLQMLCANNIDKPIGSVIHTGMLNEQGGYENDCSVIRLDQY